VPDWPELRRLGLYDPGAPDGAARRELLEYLVLEGATTREMLEAEREGRLPFVLGDRLISPGRPELTLEEVAARVGLPPATVDRCWRAVGFAAPQAGVALFAEADVRMLQLLAVAIDAFGEEGAVQMARVIGSSLSRIAEAGFATALVNVEGGYLPRAQHLVAGARAAQGLGLMTQAASVVFDVVFRRHIEVVARRFDMNPSPDPETVVLAIGFADLVGFTGISAQLSATDLSAAVNDLETLASDAAVARGGRLVKLIGDEIMFTGPDAQAAAEIAFAVLEGVDAHPLLPPMRASLAVGAVVPYEGDYFGPVVNVASRLVDTARAGELLGTEEAAATLDRSRFVTSELVPVSLKGFADPVAIRAIRPKS
jgi:adenylate cyclase